MGSAPLPFFGRWADPIPKNEKTMG